MTTPRDPRAVVLSDHLYRALLRAYPRAFRTQYREEMALVFRDSCREAHRRAGLKGLIITWRRGITDLGKNVPKEVSHALVEEVAQRAWGRSCSGCNNEVASDWQTCQYCGMFLSEGTTYPTRVTPERHTFRRNLDAYLRADPLSDYYRTDPLSGYYRTEGTPGNPPG